jgi:hypothetical protein
MKGQDGSSEEGLLGQGLKGCIGVHMGTIEISLPVRGKSKTACRCRNYSQHAFMETLPGTRHCAEEVTAALKLRSICLSSHPILQVGKLRSEKHNNSHMASSHKSWSLDLNPGSRGLAVATFHQGEGVAVRSS